MYHSQAQGEGECMGLNEDKFYIAGQVEQLLVCLSVCQWLLYGLFEVLLSSFYYQHNSTCILRLKLECEMHMVPVSHMLIVR